MSLLSATVEILLLLMMLLPEVRVCNCQAFRCTYRGKEKKRMQEQGDNPLCCITHLSVTPLQLQASLYPRPFPPASSSPSAAVATPAAAAAPPPAPALPFPRVAVSAAAAPPPPPLPPAAAPSSSQHSYGPPACLQQDQAKPASQQHRRQQEEHQQQQEGICRVLSCSVGPQQLLLQLTAAPCGSQTGGPDEVPDAVRLDFVGDRFLYKMIRKIVGALVQASLGLVQLEELQSALDRGSLPLTCYSSSGRDTSGSSKGTNSSSKVLSTNSGSKRMRGSGSSKVTDGEEETRRVEIMCAPAGGLVLQRVFLPSFLEDLLYVHPSDSGIS